MFQTDLSILRFVNQMSGQFPRLDEFIVLIAQNDLVKGGPIIAVLWWFWFKPSNSQNSHREIIVACVVAALVAAAASRTLAHILMIHRRPLLIPNLQLIQRAPTLWEDKNSSFPSDHAALAFGLITGLFYISRKAGLAMGVYAIVFICLPRLYLGVHWPSDILAGAALGIGSTALFCYQPVRARLAAPANRLAERSPQVFYALAFLVSFGLMTRFDSARSLLYWAKTSAPPVAVIHGNQQNFAVGILNATRNARNLGRPAEFLSVSGPYEAY
jgi:membrane-associated phospholipid phosphatase